MSAYDLEEPCYHGSQQKLTVLQAGNSITQNPAVARAFSHRRSLVPQYEDGSVKHDEVITGYLYVVTESIHPGDIYPHPHPVNESRWEWLTTRELSVRLVERGQLTAFVASSTRRITVRRLPRGLRATRGSLPVAPYALRLEQLSTVPRRGGRKLRVGAGRAAADAPTEYCRGR